MKGLSSVLLPSSILLTAGVLLASSTLSPASAFTFTTNGNTAGNPPQPLYDVGITQADVNKSFDVNYSLSASNTTPALSAKSTFTVNSLSSNLLQLGIKVTNTTDLAVSNLTNAAVLALGFSVTPNGTGSFTSNGQGQVFDNVSSGQGAQQQFPGGFKNIDVCIYAANNCSGGNIKDGLQAGASDSFLLNVAGNFGTSPSVTLDSLPLKFQTSAGSFELAGKPGKPVPEPGSVASILAIGAVGAFGFYKKKRPVQKDLAKVTND